MSFLILEGDLVRVGINSMSNDQRKGQSWKEECND